MGKGKKPDVALSELHLFVLAHRAIPLRGREICLPSWLGSEIVKGEDGCEFAGWNKTLLLKNYLEISSPQRIILLTCIFPTSHKCTFLNFQKPVDRWSEVCLGLWSVSVLSGTSCWSLPEISMGLFWLFL